MSEPSLPEQVGNLIPLPEVSLPPVKTSDVTPSHFSSLVGASANPQPTSPRRNIQPPSPGTPTRQLLRKKAQRLPATLPPSKPYLPHMDRFRITVEERGLFPRFWFIEFAKALSPRDPKAVRLIDAPNQLLGISPQRRAEIEKSGQAHHSNYFVLEEVSGKKFFVKRTLNRDRAKREWLAYQKFREARIPHVMYADFWFETKEEEHDKRDAGFIVFKYFPCWTLNEIDRNSEYNVQVGEEDWLRGLIQMATVFNMTDPDNVEQGSLGFYHRDMHAGQIVFNYERRDWLLIDFGLSRLLFTERRALNPARPDERSVVEVELDMVPGSAVHCTPEQEWNRLKALFKPGLKKIWSKIEDLFKESSRLTTVCKLRNFFEERYQKAYVTHPIDDPIGSGVGDEDVPEFESIFPEPEVMTYVEAAHLEHQRIQERATRNIKGFQEQVKQILANAQRARRQARGVSSHHYSPVSSPSKPKPKPKHRKSPKKLSKAEVTVTNSVESNEGVVIAAPATSTNRKLVYKSDDEIDIEADDFDGDSPSSDFEPSNLKEKDVDEDYEDDEEPKPHFRNLSMKYSSSSSSSSSSKRHSASSSSAAATDDLMMLDVDDEDLSRYMSASERAVILEARKLFSRSKRRQEGKAQQQQQFSTPEPRRHRPVSHVNNTHIPSGPTPPPPLPYPHLKEAEVTSPSIAANAESIKIRVPKTKATDTINPIRKHFSASSTPKRPLTADERLLEETNKILERENRRLQKSTPPSALATQLSSTRVSKSGTVNPKPIVYKDASSSSGYMFGEEEEGEEEELFHGEGLAGDPLVEEAEEEREEEGEEEGPVFTQQASRVAQIRCTDSEEEENVDTLHPASALSDGSSRNAFCSSEESVGNAVSSLPPELPVAPEIQKLATPTRATLPPPPLPHAQSLPLVLPPSVPQGIELPVVSVAPLAIPPPPIPFAHITVEAVTPVSSAPSSIAAPSPILTRVTSSRPSASVTPKRRRGGDADLFDEAEKMRLREVRKLERLRGHEEADEDEEEGAGDDSDGESGGIVISHQSPVKKIASTRQPITVPLPMTIPAAKSIAVQQPLITERNSTYSSSSASESSESEALVESESDADVKKKKQPRTAPRRQRTPNRRASRGEGPEEEGPVGSPSSGPQRLTRREIDTLNEEAKKMIARMERRAAGK